MAIHGQSRTSRAGRALALAGFAAIWAGTAAAQVPVASVGTAAALSTVSQRHMVRLAPAGRAPAWLVAVETDHVAMPGRSAGLGFWRSDDEGHTWAFYKPIQASNDHLVADLAVAGDDVAAVYSFDTTSTAFPQDAAKDPARRVQFQWWHHDGAGQWNAGALVTIASPPAGRAYHRAVVALDSLGRIWVQAWLRDACASCGDTAKLWVSTDGGVSFRAQPDLVHEASLGGGRLVATGGRLVFLWGTYSATEPAHLRARADGDALGAWSAARSAFPDGDPIYHGAAQNAVADGGGGFHLVYKDTVERLWYRRFDGTAFGAKRLVDGAANWAPQPAITAQGGELYVFLNHVVVAGTSYELRLYRLSRGFGTFQVLDGSASFKGYPTAAEELPAGAPQVVCAYGLDTSVRAVRVATGASAPPPPTGALPLVETFVDPFAGPGLDGALWSVRAQGAGAGVTASGGVLGIAPAPRPATATQASGAAVTSVASWRLTGSSIHVKVAGTVAAAGVNQKLRLAAPGARGLTEYLGFWLEHGLLEAFLATNQIDSPVATVPFDPVAHAWWRLREAGGTIFWETSADGASWAVLGQAPASGLTFSTDAVRVVFDALAFRSTATAPGEAQFTLLNR